jgi:hypothetical protein
MGRGLASALNCVVCGQPRESTHANARYCARCREHRRHYPPTPSTLTPEIAAAILPLLGQVPRSEIEKRFGLSKAAIYRFLREHNLKVKHFNQPEPALVEAVLRTYERGGKSLVRACFPEVNCRSIVERYKDYTPRQIRWTPSQCIEAAKMAGIVSYNAQARFFGRPNAYSGSIRSFWSKRMHCEPRFINGFPLHRVYPLAVPGTPCILVKHEQSGGARAIVLWLDLLAHLSPRVDLLIREAIEALARFQGWLHGTQSADAIRAMIQDREVNYGTG